MVGGWLNQINPQLKNQLYSGETGIATSNLLVLLLVAVPVADWHDVHEEDCCPHRPWEGHQPFAHSLGAQSLHLLDLVDPHRVALPFLLHRQLPLLCDLLRVHPLGHVDRLCACRLVPELLHREV